MGTESAENSKLQVDTRKVAMHLHCGDMSDAGKLATKLHVIDEVVAKSLFTSLKAWKSLVASLDSDLKKPEDETSRDEGTRRNEVEKGSKYVLASLFRQNLRTDSKIFLVGHMDSRSTEAAVDTLETCSRFRRNVGPYLAKMDQLRREQEEEESSESIQPVIAETKREEPPQKPAQEPIPSELASKIAELAEGPSGPNTLRPEEAPPLVDATASKINFIHSDREGMSYLSSFLSGDDVEIMRDIKKNKEQIWTQLQNAVSETKKPQAVPKENDSEPSASKEHAKEARERQLGSIGRQLFQDSVGFVKEFCFRARKVAFKVCARYHTSRA